MIITGVIAEYNPLHNGHIYHLEQVKNLTSSNRIVVALSGNFCQRGYPAILDKMCRTKMALLAGADMVVEIPTVFATSSAQDYARGGVATLNALGCVDNLCFGSEEKNIKKLLEAAEKIDSSIVNKEEIKKAYKDKQTYASAMASLLDDEELLKPNNILAIEYLRALNATNSKIKPVCVERLGDYSNDTLPASTTSYPSAKAIRKAMQDTDIKAVADYIPDFVYEELLELRKNAGPIDYNDFNEELRYALILNSQKGYEDFLGIDRSLSDRIANNLLSFKDIESFILLIKTKNLTYSHVARALLHILLDIKKSDFTNLTTMDSTPYVRVLGFRNEAGDLLRTIKESTSANIIYTASDAKKYLADTNDAYLLKDIFSTDIYNNTFNKKYGQALPKDFAIPVLKI